MSENILAKPVRMKYQEPAAEVNFPEFEKVVRSRRSVRQYEPTAIPDADVEKALELALLAPNSSNLQPWEFYWVHTEDKKKKLAEACFSQNAAQSAPVLIVCVARPNHWKKHARQMLELFSKESEVPSIADKYYRVVVPLVYRVGPMSVLGLARKVFFSIAGLFRSVPRGPATYSELREWAVKTTALACENLMLSFRALGYDSCPMEGFDEVRVRRLLKLPSDAHIVMVVSAGKRAEHGVYGKQVRFPKEQFVFKV